VYRLTQRHLIPACSASGRLPGVRSPSEQPNPARGPGVPEETTVLCGTRWTAAPRWPTR